MLQPENKFKEKIISIILCAGEGARAKSITENIPKALLKIKSFDYQPLLSLIIENLVLLKLDRIVVVTGHLGRLIEDYLNSPQIKSQYSDATILSNSSRGQYKFGSLHSLLSITTNTRIFKDDNIFLIFPGDTFFDIKLLKEVLDLLIVNFSHTLFNSIIFYRKIRADVLKRWFRKYYPQQQITISFLKIEEKGPKTTLKEISQKQLNMFSNEEYINQIIPIFIFNYTFVNEILELTKSIKFSYIREVVNFMAKKNKTFLALAVNPEHNFYDIDNPLDLKILNAKKKGGQ
ncbi:MAG: NTP transferase domain-containing protein [Promethearchaeota archaeon]